MIITDKKICYSPESPCLECLVKMTCTKSIKENTVCDLYKQFILNLVEKEYANTIRLRNK